MGRTESAFSLPSLLITLVRTGVIESIAARWASMPVLLIVTCFLRASFQSGLI